MTKDDFQTLILETKSPENLVIDFLTSPLITAFPDNNRYKEFCGQVFNVYARSEDVVVAGSGNWGYSLNPYKFFKPYDVKSDLDVVVISFDDFLDTWEALRAYQRNNWYGLSPEMKEQIRANGNNIYCGFVSPSWIPERHPLKYKFKSAEQALSNEKVNYRDVRMRLFRNWDEVIDYYRRGVIIAKQALKTKKQTEVG